MISWTKLLTGQAQDSDNLRYAHTHGLIPKIVVWNTTSRCNLRCRHCYFNATDSCDPLELTKDEAKCLIEDLAGLNVPVLLFSGGEPLLREDLFELGGFARDKGIKTILSTNGTLITKKTARRIKEAGFSYAGISLDGMQEINDWFRCSRGAFSEALTGIRNCRDSGIKVGLRFTVTRDNLKELPHIFGFAEKESIQRICLYHLVYTGRGSSLKDRDTTLQEKRGMLEFIWGKTMDFHKKGMNIEILTVDNHADGVWIYLRFKKHNAGRAEEVLGLLKTQGGNSSGVNIGAVDNRGNIFADQFWRAHPLGNVRERPFSEVWENNGGNFLKDLRNRKALIKGRCSRCKYLDICNANFRARAEAVSCDPWAEDPACYLTDEEIGSL